MTGKEPFGTGGREAKRRNGRRDGRPSGVRRARLQSLEGTEGETCGNGEYWLAT